MPDIGFAPCQAHLCVCATLVKKYAQRTMHGLQQLALSHSRALTYKSLSLACHGWPLSMTSLLNSEPVLLDHPDVYNQKPLHADCSAHAAATLETVPLISQTPGALPLLRHASLPQMHKW